MMPARKPPDPSPNTGQDDPAKIDRFIDTARALGCDEDEAAFKAKLAVIARQKPKDAKQPPTDKNKQK